MRKFLYGILCAALLCLPAHAVNLYPTPTRNITANSSNVASFNTDAAVIASQSLSTAAQGFAVFTFYSPSITAASIVLVSFANGTITAGSPQIQAVTPASGVVVVTIFNANASIAFNGTIVLSLIVFN